MYSATIRSATRFLVLFFAVFNTFSISAQNNALDFDDASVSDFVQISDDNSLDFTSTMTLEAWINLEDVTGFRGIISKFFSGGITSQNNSYALYLDDGKVTVAIHESDDSFTVVGESTASISANTWYHIAAVADGSGNLLVYVNGIQVASGSYDNTILSGTRDLFIGKFRSEDGFAVTDGIIDEVRLWNDARTVLEIRTNMTRSLTGSEANLVAYYNFNEGTANADNTGVSAPEIQDQTSNNNDGTLNNFAKSGTASNWVDGSGNDVGATFITTWQTTTASETVQLPTGSGTYNYTINWGDGTVETLTAGDPSHVYASSGTYAISIDGTFPHFEMENNSTYRNKLLSVEQWGDISWTSMQDAFWGCSNVVSNATDVPNMSSVTDMSRMFNNAASFDADLSAWDVSNVTTMSQLFDGCSNFNNGSTALSWGSKTSNVLNMSSMFSNAAVFNQDVSDWDMSSVQNVSGMFNGATAFNNGGLSLDWGTSTSNISNMLFMFLRATNFNQDISSWDVSSVTTMEGMFEEATSFNNGGVALNWGSTTANVTTMTSMFLIASSFNQDISGWDLSSITSMGRMFDQATAYNNGGMPLTLTLNTTVGLSLAGMFQFATSFNQDVSNLNVTGVTSMNSMFRSATAFNNGGQPLDWGSQTSNVTIIGGMFANATSFNQDVSSWDVSSVTNMAQTFQGASAFNNGGVILNWDSNTSATLNMTQMFESASVFNQDISGWDVASVTNFRFLFNSASAFDQNLGSWDISSATDMGLMFRNAGMSTASYDNTLIGWATLEAGESQIPTGITLGGTGQTYCASKVERSSLDVTYDWTFTGDAIETGCVEINLQGNGTNIADGASTPLIADGTDFGNVASSLAQDFTIQSTGAGSVTVSSIDVSGTHSSEFVISGITTPANIASGANTTFTVTFTPTGSGNRTATITINSDDADETAYDFAVQGSGPAPGGISTGLGAWYKADEGVSGTSPVTAWADQSGNGLDLNDRDGTEPAYVSDGLNFNPVVDFPSNDKLSRASVPSSSLRTETTVSVYGVFNTNSGRVVLEHGPDPFATPSERFTLEYNRGGWDETFETPASSVVGTQHSIASWIVDTPNASWHINGDGGQTLGTSYNSAASATYTLTVGDWSSNTLGINGNIAEVIVFSQAHSNTDRNKVESYLAIKYGITLDQTSATNYLAADGGTVWNATTNAAYNDDIAGLARDDASELDQRQSGSINSGAILELANGTHASPSTYSTDDSWLIWGHNGGATTFGSGNINNSNATTSNRMARVWRAQETGTVGSVEIRFSNSVATGTVSLVAHTSDANFPVDGNRRVVEMVDDGTHYSASIDLADGEYFSFVNANYATLTSQFVVINEVITDPQQDWGASNFFNPSPGGTGDSDDEWIELYIATDNLDLTNWTIEMNDGTDVSGSLAAGGAFNQSNYRSLTGGFFNDTKAGDYLILGDPSSGMMNSVGGLTVVLKDGNGGTIDQVTIATGSGTGFSGSASSTTDESVARIPNGADTDVDATDFVKTLATLGNSSSPSGTVVINEIVTDPFTDWSSGGFDGSVAGSTVTNIDEWVELYIGTDGLNLTGWTISLIDGSGDVVDQSIAAGGAFSVNQYFGSGSFINTAAGDYLVLGNPGSGTSAMRNDVQIILKDASGNTIDQVQLGGGSGEAPDGANSAFNSEAIVRYPNATDTNADDADFIQTRPTLGTTNSPVGTVLINEVVTDPKQDWSTNAFDGTIGGTTIDADDEDEWVELYIASSEINLTGWTISLEDGTGDIVDQTLAAGGAFSTSNYIVNSMIGSFENTEAGDFLVLGNPTGTGTVQMDNNVQITLKDASGNIVDQVKLGGGSGEAPSGASTGISDEAIARIPNGSDTNNDATDFSAGPATLGTTNQTAQLPGVGNSLVFDGTDDFVDLTKVFLLSGLTYSAWIKTTSTDATAGYDGNSALSIIGEVSNDIWNSFGIHGGLARYRHYTGSWNGIQGTTSVNDGNWHHVAVSHNQSTGEAILYVDGILEASSTLTYGGGGGAAKVGFNRIAGSFGTVSTTADFFNGEIDEVRVWSTVRTQEQILEEMMGLIDPASSGLEVYYRHDQTSGTSLPDLTSNGNNGTLNNMAGTEWTAAGWDIFAQNQAILQSGGSDISTGTSGELTLTDVSFLNDDNDLLLAGHDNGSFTEEFADLPSGTLVTSRYGRIWNLRKNDASGTSNGSVNLGFDLGASPNVTYNYYLLERTGTSGDFAIVPVLGVNPNGNSIEFTIDASALDNGSYYTMGRSDAGVGNALSFDASDDYLTVPHNSALNLNSNDFTIEAWVYPKATGPGSVLLKGAGSLISEAEDYHVNIFNSKIYLSLGKDANFSESKFSTSDLNINAWNHIAVVYNSSTMTVTFYLNGQSDNSETYSGTLHTTDTNDLYIGRQGANGGGNFNGDMDEIRLWNDQRTQQELLENMFTNLTGDEANLVAYYRFNQGIGDGNTSLPDLSPNSFGATLINFDNLGSSTTSSNYISSTRTGIATSVIIANGGNLTATDGELTLTSTQTAGNFLQDANDFIRWNNDGADFTETAADIPTGTLITNRYTKTWQLDKNDAVGTANGNVTFTFDLGAVPDPDYTYFVLSRSGTSGDFSIVEALSSSPSGNTIAFTVDAGEITDDNYFTLGRTEAGAGNTIDFDADNDYIEVADADAFTFGNGTTDSPFSIETWVRIDNTAEFTMISKKSGGLAAGEWYMGSGTGGQYHVTLWDESTGGSVYQQTAAGLFSAGEWYHLAFTYDGSGSANGLTLYVDGIASNDGTGGSGSYTAMENTTSSVQFGVVTNTFSNLDGALDEIRVWSDVRTEQEIRDNMNRKLDVANESNLVGYYQFNTGIADGTNTGVDVLTDRSGNGHSGTLTNLALSGTASNWVASTATVADQTLGTSLQGAGNALDFDGSNDYVSIPDNDVFSFGNGTSDSPFSVEFWMSLDNQSTGTFVSKRVGTNEWDIYMSGSQLVVSLRDASTTGTISASTFGLSTGQWYHVAVVYDGSGDHTGIQIYTDGILNVFNTFASGSYTAMENGTSPVEIGITNNTVTPLDGRMDELRIWNTARTASEIQSNMFESLTGSETGLVAYYTFDESSGTTLDDNSTNSNTGTLNNMEDADWVDASAREPFKTNGPGNLNSGATWVGGAAPGASQTLYVQHDLTVDANLTVDDFNLTSGNTLTLGAGQTLTITGNLVNNGTITGDGKIQFTSGNPMISGGTFSNLEMNGGSPILCGNTTLTGTLTMTNGNLQLEGFNLTLNSGATISGGSSSSYIQTINQNSSGGSVSMEIGSSNGVVTYPIGTSTNYTPIFFTNLGSTATFAIRTFDGIYTENTSGTAITSEVISKTWDVNATGSGFNVTLSIQWNTADETSGFDRSNMFVSTNDGSGWVQRSGQVSASEVSSGIYQATASGITGFSGVGGGGDVITPVTLLDFYALEMEEAIELVWHTATEINNEKFMIERSADGIEFTAIDEIPGNGDSDDIIEYRYVDTEPLVGSNYYRLKQMDFDGEFEYSPIVLAETERITHDLVVYPNPFSDRLYIGLKEADVPANVKLTSMNGQVILSESVISNNRFVQFENLQASPGIYILEIEQGGEVVRMRIVNE